LLKKATFLLFFILCQTANCQIKISGVIVDNNGLPIQGASVTIKSIENNSSLGYTFSVKDGIFDISIPSKTQNAIIKVTHLGYKAFSKVFVIQDRYTKLDNIIITQNTSKLNEVILKAEKRRIQKGDTTVFKVDKYINGTEENLKDVLDKIEGFDINNQGKITINGKQIDRLLVDGENLYKNQHSFATDNIPASLVGDLELIKNYSDFDALKTKEKSGITALNVKIKD
jgi:hypothetical protein